MKLRRVAPNRLGLLQGTGIGLLPARQLHLGLAALGVATEGILLPIVLFPDHVFFSRAVFAPTLDARYVLIVAALLAASLVVTAVALADAKSGRGASDCTKSPTRSRRTRGDAT